MFTADLGGRVQLKDLVAVQNMPDKNYSRSRALHRECIAQGGARVMDGEWQSVCLHAWLVVSGFIQVQYQMIGGALATLPRFYWRKNYHSGL